MKIEPVIGFGSDYIPELTLHSSKFTVSSTSLVPRGRYLQNYKKLL